jgi:hypothetical protein
MYFTLRNNDLSNAKVDIAVNGGVKIKTASKKNIAKVRSYTPVSNFKSILLYNPPKNNPLIK